MSQRTPLYGIEEKAGAHFADYAGWLMPKHFGDPLAEYRTAREQAVVIDVSHRSKIEIQGADRLGFLQNFCTNDVVQLPAGHGCEAFLTSPQAKILAHLRIFKHDDSLWLDAAPGLGARIAQHLERYHITENVEIIDRTAEYAQVHLTGPLLLTLCDADSARRMERLSDLEGFGTKDRGGAVQVRRNDVLGQPGYDVVISPARPQWNEAARWAGMAAFEILRIEAGTPEYGQDIDDSNLPQEVNRTERAISFTKGCYVGQETVARIKAYGHVNRLLVGLRFPEARTVPPGARVLAGEQEIGKVTSCVVSPRLGAGIALGYVRRGHEQPGKAVEVEADAGRIPATVSGLPFGVESGGS